MGGRMPRSAVDDRLAPSFLVSLDGGSAMADALCTMLPKAGRVVMRPHLWLALTSLAAAPLAAADPPPNAIAASSPKAPSPSGMTSEAFQRQLAQMGQLSRSNATQVAAKAAIDRFLADMARAKHNQQVLAGKFGMWQQARLAWQLGRYGILVVLAFKLALLAVAALAAFSAVMGLLYALSGLFRRRATQ
jgi:hypothetical protein